MDWKDRLGVVYSTSNEYEYDNNKDLSDETLEPSKQRLRITLDKKQRNGKKVTLITGFIGTENDIKVLGKRLKTKCGVGGSVKDGEIIIQGDFRERVKEVLIVEGYKNSK